MFEKLFDLLFGKHRIYYYTHHDSPVKYKRFRTSREARYFMNNWRYPACYQPPKNSEYSER